MFSCRLHGNPPEGPEIGAKRPLAEMSFFPLDLRPDFGESRSATTNYSPVSTGITARHWRALLFVGFAFSVFLARRDAAIAPRKRGVWIFL